MAVIPIEFAINVIGENTQETFKGVFKVKPRLSHRDTLLQDQMRRDLLGPKPAEAGQSAIASAMVFSKIWIHTVDAPNFWKEAGNGVDLIDESPVVAVYDNIIRIENEAKKKVEAAAEEAAKDLKEQAK